MWHFNTEESSLITSISKVESFTLRQQKESSRREQTLAAHKDLTSLTLSFWECSCVFTGQTPIQLIAFGLPAVQWEIASFLLPSLWYTTEMHSNTKQSGCASFGGRTIPVCFKLGSGRQADNTKGSELQLFSWQPVLAWWLGQHPQVLNAWKLFGRAAWLGSAGNHYIWPTEYESPIHLLSIYICYQQTYGLQQTREQTLLHSHFFIFPSICWCTLSWD